MYAVSLPYIHESQICLFKTAAAQGRPVRSGVKTIVLLSAAFLLLAVETLLKERDAFSGLLAVVSMACALKIRCGEAVPARLASQFGKLWFAAEALLFVLVGAAVDIRYTLEAGIAAVAMIFIALAFRCLGVILCLFKTPLNRKERLFCTLAYLPKATVQAAIGSVPLAMGLRCGKTVLSIAVLGILITAPLGALAIDKSYRRLLHRCE